MCCLESNVYLPPCPSSGEYRSDINPFKEPDKPITGACFAERVVNGFTTKVTALPQCGRFTGNSFNNYTHDLYMEFWGTNQEEVANLALVGEAIFRELFNGMECVTEHIGNSFVKS